MKPLLYYHQITFSTGVGMEVKTFAAIAFSELPQLAIDQFTGDPKEHFYAEDSEGNISIRRKRDLRVAKVVPLLCYEGFKLESWGTTKQEAALRAKKAMIKALKNISELQIMGLEVLEKL